MTSPEPTEAFSPAGFARRVSSGTAANVIRQVINIGSEILLVPILLTAWGAGRYGEWQILSAAVAYFTVLDLGTHTYAINRLNECYNRGEWAEFTRNLHSALMVAILAAGFGLVFAIPAAMLAPVTSWFHLSATGSGTAALVLVALALHAAMALPIGMVAGVYRAVGEYARDININNVYRTVTCLATAAIALAGGGLGPVAIAQLLAFAGTLGYIIIDIRRRHPHVQLGLRRAEGRLVLSLMLPSMLFLLIQASASAVVQGSVLLVGAAAGTTAVAVFTTLRTLVNGVPQVVNSISGTLWPELTALHARGQKKSLRDLHRLSAKVILWLGIVSAVFLHFTAADIVALWTGGRIQFDQQLIDAMLGLELLTTWSLASSTMIAALSRPRTLAIAQVSTTAIGLGLGWLYLYLPRAWARSAWCSASGSPRFAISAWFIPLCACWLVGDRFPRFAADVLGRGLVAGCAVLLTVGIVSPLIDPGLVRAAATWALTGAVGLPILLAFWLSKRERERLGLFVPAPLRQIAGAIMSE